MRSAQLSKPLTKVYWAGDEESPIKSVTGKPVNFHEIKKEFNASKLWEDADFPPNADSLGRLDGDTAAGAAGKTEKKIHWIRPHEICKSNGINRPHFVVVQDADEDKTPFSESDLKQGGLGDCWYIAALQALITRPHHLHNVIPKDNFNGFDDGKYCGAFHFRFYDMETGKWVDLVIDDQLPCTKDGDQYTPAFAKFSAKFSGATVAEFWPALIEKAFAKLVGSFARIEGGFMSQALCNFTGGFDEFFYLRPPRPNKYEFFKSRIETCFAANGFVGLMTHEVENACAKGCLQGYSHYSKCLDDSGKWTGEVTACGYKKNPDTGVPEEDKSATGFGLLGPHAYTAIGAKQLSTKDGANSYFLIQVRNPHAAHEWTGKFGDSDETNWALMEEDLRAQNKAGSKEIDDGVFWIELNDVIEYYYAIEFCSPKGIGKADKLAVLRSEWPAALHSTSIDIQEDVSAEWTEFPAFKFDVKSAGDDPDAKSTLAITLVLNNYHALLDPNPYFTFSVYKAPSGELDKGALAEMYTKEKIAIDSPGRQGRDVSVFQEDVDPGQYILVAALLTAPIGERIIMPEEFKGKPLGFTVRVWTEAQTELKQVVFG